VYYCGLTVYNKRICYVMLCNNQMILRVFKAISRNCKPFKFYNIAFVSCRWWNTEAFNWSCKP